MFSSPASRESGAQVHVLWVGPWGSRVSPPRWSGTGGEGQHAFPEQQVLVVVQHGVRDGGRTTLARSCPGMAGGWRCFKERVGGEDAGKMQDGFSVDLFLASM